MRQGGKLILAIQLRWEIHALQCVVSVLSKGFLLAEDDKIKDETITKQIKGEK